MVENTCSEVGCERRSEKRGWCEFHYRRWYRYGDPQATASGYVGTGPIRLTGLTPLTRLWAGVDRRGDNECWPWIRGVDTYGYGALTIAGRVWKAHRLAYVLLVGPIPTEKPHVLHHCDNPPCCNPTHLWPGTQADNMADMRRKNRQARGSMKANRRKTHCVNGHEFAGDNLATSLKGYRICRACSRESARRYRARLYYEDEQATI